MTLSELLQHFSTCFLKTRCIIQMCIWLKILLRSTSVVFSRLQSTTSVSAGSTTATRMPYALTWLEATVVPVSRATLGMGRSAKVSTAMLVMLFIVSCPTQVDFQDGRNTVAVVKHLPDMNYLLTFHFKQRTLLSVPGSTNKICHKKHSSSYLESAIRNKGHFAKKSSP